MKQLFSINKSLPKDRQRGCKKTPLKKSAGTVKSQPIFGIINYATNSKYQR